MGHTLVAGCLVPRLGAGGDGHGSKGLYRPPWPPEGDWFWGKFSNASDEAALGEQST